MYVCVVGALVSSLLNYFHFLLFGILCSGVLRCMPSYLWPSERNDFTSEDHKKSLIWFHTVGGLDHTIATLTDIQMNIVNSVQLSFYAFYPNIIKL